MIIRNGVDVTQEIASQVEALRTGPRGQRQRDSLFGILTHALLEIEAIPTPWLDDCIDEARQAIRKLRATIPHN